MSKAGMKKEMKIPSIKEGTVIDHIPAKVAFKVANLLDVANMGNVVSVATNLRSKTLGEKGIIKIGGKFLTEEEVDKIAVVAPKATVNIIKDYRVKEKIKVKLPDVIEKIVKCSNPDCITNNEEVKTKFYALCKEPLKIRCHYCERCMQREDIELI